jgi:hypothetical protein
MHPGQFRGYGKGGGRRLRSGENSGTEARRKEEYENTGWPKTKA